VANEPRSDQSAVVFPAVADFASSITNTGEPLLRRNLQARQRSVVRQVVRQRRDVPRRTPGEGIAFPQSAAHRLSRYRHRRDVHRPHLPGAAPFRPTRRARGLRALARTPGRPGCAAAILGERARPRCLRSIANDAPAPARWVEKLGKPAGTLCQECPFITRRCRDVQ